MPANVESALATRIKWVPIVATTRGSSIAGHHVVVSCHGYGAEIGYPVIDCWEEGLHCLSKVEVDDFGEYSEIW